MSSSDEPDFSGAPTYACRSVREDACWYVADEPEVGSGRRGEIRTHLEECGGCRAHYRSMAALQASLPLWEAPRGSASLTERIVEAARVEPSPGWLRRFASRRLTIPGPVAVASALLLIALLALEIGSLLSPDRRTGRRLDLSGGELALVPFSEEAHGGRPAAFDAVAGPDPAMIRSILSSERQSR